MKTAERFGISEFVYGNGTTAWRVQGRMRDGRQIRKNFKTLKDALAAKSDFEQPALGVPAQIGLRKTRLTELQLVDAEAAYARMHSSVTEHPWLKEKTLLFMVEYMISNYSEPVNPKTITEAYGERTQMGAFLEEEFLGHLVGFAVA
jgi:hypothetical protein